LGLAIVERVVELHQARIELGESSLHGLQVDVFFPLNQESAG
jgi:signal transduction histidine kinase